MRNTNESWRRVNRILCNGGTELASPTINLNGGLVAYVTENSTFKGGTANY